MSREAAAGLAILLTLVTPAGVSNGARAEERQPLYYQDPSGKLDYSPGPKKDAQGRDYVPVYEDTGASPAPANAPSLPAPAEIGRAHV